MIKINMRFDEDLMEDVKKYAEKNKMEIAKYVRELVKKAIQMEKYKEGKGEDFDDRNTFTEEDRKLLFETYLYAKVAMRRPNNVNQDMIKNAEATIEHEIKKRIQDEQN